MKERQELESYLRECLEVEFFSDYCDNGLQVEGKKQVRTIATAVSASLDAIQKAVELQVDALFVHHGLFWKGDSYAVVEEKREKLTLLLENQISLFAYHLPLDAHRKLGNNWRAAQAMGWENLEPFGVFNGCSIGVKGTFPAVSVGEFQSQLEGFYEHTAHAALGGKQKVASAALISGGAYRSLTDAVKEGVDCFITGNFDEPAWHQAFEKKIHFFALGHSATERIGPRSLGEHLEEKWGLPCQFISDNNPF